ncbi:MAG: ribonuclease III [Rhodothalassiaceae bacterium]
MMDAVDVLAQALGRRLSDPQLAEMALTHPSLGGRRHYQRLEFVGDRVFGLAVAGALYEHFPDAPEGQLNRRLSALVRTESLAELAQRLGLAEHIRVETGARNEGAHTKPGVLADVMEAAIGAVYLDQGFDAAREVVLALVQDRLTAAVAAGKDAKSRLQEWALGRALPLPKYQIVERTGPDHAPRFTVEVAIQGEAPARAKGAAKQAAEQAAAQALLDRIGGS